MLYDRPGRLVLQRRAAGKRTHPLFWDLSATGHVEEPDYPDPLRPDDGLAAIYDAVARRELFEELGVETELERLGRFGPEPAIHYEHFVLYRGVHDGPYRAQPEEVAEIRAFGRAAVDALIAGPELTTPSLGWLVEWSHRNGRDLY